MRSFNEPCMIHDNTRHFYGDNWGDWRAVYRIRSNCSFSTGEPHAGRRFVMLMTGSGHPRNKGLVPDDDSVGFEELDSAGPRKLIWYATRNWPDRRRHIF